jgi:dTDP-4-dehydrorhamnose reductase
MNLKILLTGKNGQIGHELSRLLPQLGDVVALDRQQVDLTKPEQIRHAIRDARPQIIVNTAAYTAVDQAEKEEALARTINADAPGLMAEEAKKIGAVLVHYSTDYVFDGSKTSPYVENDPPNPINAYGRTKLAGEQAIAAASAAHLIIRTAWVYGTRGKNFLLTILRLATESEELRIVRDQTGAPTWAREIAAATTRILKQVSGREGPVASLSNLGGIYHMTAAGETNWCEFAQAILNLAGQAPAKAPWFVSATEGRPIVTRRIVPITTAEYPTAACRPAYSVLSNSRCQRIFGFALPDWKAQLQSVMAQP